MLPTLACAIKPTALQATARRERHPNQEYKLNDLHPSPLPLPASVMTKYLLGPVHRTLLHTHFGEVVGYCENGLVVREGGRDRQTDRQTDRQNDKERNRDRQTGTDRDSNREKERAEQNRKGDGGGGPVLCLISVDDSSVRFQRAIAWYVTTMVYASAGQPEV